MKRLKMKKNKLTQREAIISRDIGKPKVLAARKNKVKRVDHDARKKRLLALRGK